MSITRLSSHLVKLPDSPGTLDKAMVDIYVDSLGDFNQGQPGCSDAINAKIQELTGMANSVYINGMNVFYCVRFGRGVYKLNGTIVFPGVFFVGVPGWGTRLIPGAGLSAYMFTTVGTQPFDLSGVRVWARAMYWGFRDLTFGEYWEGREDFASGVGGINIKFSSYGNFENVRFRRIRARAILGNELFDTRFSNVSMMYCGDDSNPSNIIPCFELNDSGSDDVTNACHFTRLHLEANYAGIRFTRCRHMSFESSKLERDDTSHLLEGCQGLVWTATEHTWNSTTSPQFLITPTDSSTKTSDSWGIKFIASECISSGVRGWYFHHTGTGGPLTLTDLSARGTGVIASGTRIVITGGDTYDCGPTIVKASSSVKIEGVSWLAVKAPDIGTGEDDCIVISGDNCSVQSSEFSGQAKSGAIPNGAFINTAASTDTIITDNTYGGYRQYGHRLGTNTQQVRDNKISRISANITSLSNLGVNNSSLVNRNTTGFGLGEVFSEVFTVNAGASVEKLQIKGGTRVQMRVIGSATSSAEFLADSSNSGLAGAVATNGSFLNFTAGTLGDGLVHVLKPATGGSYTIQNYSSQNITVVALYITTMV